MTAIAGGGFDKGIPDTYVLLKLANQKVKVVPTIGGLVDRAVRDELYLVVERNEVIGKVRRAWRSLKACTLVEGHHRNRTDSIDHATIFTNFRPAPGFRVSVLDLVTS